MDNNNPTDPNAGGTPVVDPNAGAPVADAPMGGSVYTPPAAPVEPVVETPVETPAPLGDQPTPEVGGEQNPGGQPTGGTPMV